MAFLQFSKNKIIKDNVPPPTEKKQADERKQEHEAPMKVAIKPYLLSCALEVAPFIKGLIGGDIGFYISDLDNYLYVRPGKVKLALDTGDPVKDGSIARRSMLSAAREVARVGKEVYGIPYIGTGYPLINPADKKVIGSLVINTPVEQQEGLTAMAGHMESQINTIAVAVANFSATSQELTATMENLNSNAQGIKEEIKKTDGIVTMIQEISEQTHMLGLNAAIEAARVGDAGRGFNVVAKEIRKLSQDTSRSVKDILLILGEMKHSIMELTNFIDQVTEAAQQQAVSVQYINSSINELSMVSVELKKQSDDLI
ncbi:MAG: methyl-accepting chemotaxis protein [Firmicutes bacterium]|nr:methyl-accepting chemotaxis protein [Bacillota bacterium]MCL5058951.1 methyl-accepting chemotaxis protein [Actinomycetota bacterium]